MNVELQDIEIRKTRDPRKVLRQDGFTLVELLIVVAIIITLAAIAVPNLMAALQRARIARAVGDLHTIGTEVQVFEAMNGAYPASLDDIGYGDRRDPWGSPYCYLRFAGLKGKGQMRKDRFLVPINTYFDLYSMGPDRKSVAPLTAQSSRDDVIWANDGSFVGPASQY